MHGGAAGSGAPKGNTNALKNGHYTKEAIEERREQRRDAKWAMRTLKELGFGVIPW